MCQSVTEFSLDEVRVPRHKKESGTNIIVCPFTIAVSSNEVAHAMDYTFTGMEGKDGDLLVVPTLACHLKTGDYSLIGLEDRVCVERKQLEDLFMCCGTDRERFHAEVERMAEMEFSVVVIEADWREILDPQEHRPGWQSEMNPQSVEGTILAWSIRYRAVHWIAAGDRRGAECLTFSVLQKFWTEQQKQQQQKHTR